MGTEQTIAYSQPDTARYAEKILILSKQSDNFITKISKAGDGLAHDAEMYRLSAACIINELDELTEKISKDMSNLLDADAFTERISQDTFNPLETFAIPGDDKNLHNQIQVTLELLRQDVALIGIYRKRLEQIRCDLEMLDMAYRQNRETSKFLIQKRILENISQYAKEDMH